MNEQAKEIEKEQKLLLAQEERLISGDHQKPPQEVKDGRTKELEKEQKLLLSQDGVREESLARAARDASSPEEGMQSVKDLGAMLASQERRNTAAAANVKEPTKRRPSPPPGQPPSVPRKRDDLQKLCQEKLERALDSNYDPVIGKAKGKSTSAGAASATSSLQPQISAPGAFAVAGINSSSNNTGDDNDALSQTFEEAQTTTVTSDDGINNCTPPSNPIPPTPLVATLASEPRVGQSPRDIPNIPAPQEFAVEVKALEEEGKQAKKTAMILAVLVFVIVIVVMALGLAGVFQKDATGGPSTDSSGSPSTEGEEPEASETVISAPISALQKIQQRGVLGCTLLPYEKAGWQFTDKATGERQGLFISMCEAIAAAALGNMSLVNYTTISSFSAMFQDLMYNDDIDILSIGITHTMEREVNESSIDAGLAFSQPYFYPGVGLGGDPFFVDCAGNNFKNYAECRGLNICAVDSTALLSKLISARQLTLTFSTEEIYDSFLNGTCNVIAGSHLFLASTVRDILYERGYQGEFSVGDFSLEKEPLTVVTTTEDPVFSDFVNVVVESLFVAEIHNITQQSADLFSETTVFGEDYRHMFQHAIQANGNMAEIFEKCMGPYGLKRTLGNVNNGTTGLLTTSPLGDVTELRMETAIGPTLQSILDRGKLRCAVADQGPGLSTLDADTWTGMNIEFCRALAAAIFGDGGDTTVELVGMESISDGFVLLSMDQVDVSAGALWNLENDVREPSTGVGFSFSSPYYYGPGDENACLATRQDDHQWTAFVDWTVAATVLAEERNVTQRTFHDMPQVNLFGPTFTRMFRSIILAVGNYQEIYDRTLEPFVTRGGRNLINAGPHYGPQVYALPGMI